MRRLVWILPVLLGLALVGCSDDDDDNGGGGLPAVEAIAVDGITGVPQMIPTLDDDGWTCAGGANRWDVEDDFSIGDGGDDQFDGALELQVGSTWFPSDQTYDELTFFTPRQGAAEGWRNAVVNDDQHGHSDLEGEYSAVLGAASAAVLYQEVDLTNATAPIQLTWLDRVQIGDTDFGGEESWYRVVLRQPDGTALATLYEITGYQNLSQANRDADLSAYAGQAIRVSFEQHNPGWPMGTLVDAVSVTDDAATEFITNGDFETGDLSGWSMPEMRESANFKSGDRVLEGLVVNRRFYTRPDRMWARWVDSFYNPTDQTIAVDVAYDTDLGSDDYGIIYETPGCSGDALTTWDGDASDRDIGFHFGNADMLTWLSDNGLGNGDGSDEITAVYQLSVPPGEVRALVVFLVMHGGDTGATATSVTERADEVDDVLQQLDTFRPGAGSFAFGIESDLIDKVVNW